MNKHIFCVFIFLVIVSLLILYYKKVRENYEFFDITPADQATYAAAIENAVETATENVIAAVNENTNPVNVKKSFLIYGDRFYMVDTDGKIYCKYISGGNWFQLCENYKPSQYISSSLKDITITKENNILYIYAIFGNGVCKKEVENSEDSWEYLSTINSIGTVTQISSNESYLIFNIPTVPDEESEVSKSGVYIYNLNGNSAPIQIDQSTNYISLRLNPYANNNYFYGLYKDSSDDDVLPIKKSFDESATPEEDDYDDSFEFGEITFVDLFVTNNFLYGLGNNKYVYRKSIKIDMVGNESYTWNKVTSMIPSGSALNNKKKISVYNGYIYCLINESIKKHRINGYSWISIDNSNYENQYYTLPPVKIIKTIHNRTDSNVDQRVLNMTPMGDFSFADTYKKN